MTQEELDAMRALGDDALLSQLVQLTAEERAAGRMDAETLRQTYESLTPFLSQAQQKKLRGILELLER